MKALRRAVVKKLENWVARSSLVGNSTFFSVEQFPWATQLEENWLVIRKELEQVLEYVDELPNFQDISPRQRRIANDNRWKTYFFFAFGFKATKNCERCPETTKLLEQIPGMKVAFFSILAPGKHIPEHRGKYIGVIRYHLGLMVPEPKTACRIRVNDEVAYWEEGKSLLFDDTFPHEVWNDTNGYRVVLFLDIVRPLRFPLSVVNSLACRLIAASPIIQDAKANHESWEKRFAEVVK
ncbi:aspartyl/asparaginyl beta-hydroxylase domain-containing protein [Microcoleus sp. FACHB-SPT15]|uniref:aspartyl/asparaginyl beta-hydroxylase domain-containing protein n=1 Tax=Microcoleus sp. FACHB-SPT15 TaxID=2692830 RepID=UPI00178141AA|nr:aspartyl/asparaginyl beta-hydroxylase domain-containing protein [Microcoleus sp. FACHB-SPT15]MBD1807833.1 aspartyl/asparaginyl beta-hydroxylase domain-containing protein [Microcoleus sp. FACHB-SPT15]